MTIIVDINKLCVCENIPLSDRKDSTNSHREVGKVILPTQETWQNFFFSTKIIYTSLLTTL